MASYFKYLDDWIRKDKEAQIEAVTRLGLPANNTAKDRAKAMGFSDETYYHGTDKPFDEFKFNESNGAGGIGGESTWFTDNPNVASSYADYVAKQNLSNAQRKLLKMYNNGTISNIEYFTKLDEINKGGVLIPDGNIPINEYISANKELNSTVGQGAQVYPVKIRKGKSQSYDMAGESYKDSDGFISEYMDGKIERAKNFKDDTTVFTDLDDHVQHGAKIPPSTHISVNNQANIRSPLAHFNPKYAGVGAGSVLSADLMADELDLEYKPKPSMFKELMKTIGNVNKAQVEANANLGAGVINGVGGLLADPSVMAEIAVKGMAGLGLGGLLMSNDLNAGEDQQLFLQRLKQR